MVRVKPIVTCDILFDFRVLNILESHGIDIFIFKNLVHKALEIDIVSCNISTYNMFVMGAFKKEPRFNELLSVTNISEKDAVYTLKKVQIVFETAKDNFLADNIYIKLLKANLKRLPRAELIELIPRLEKPLLRASESPSKMYDMLGVIYYTLNITPENLDMLYLASNYSIMANLKESSKLYKEGTASFLSAIFRTLKMLAYEDRMINPSSKAVVDTVKRVKHAHNILENTQIDLKLKLIPEGYYFKYKNCEIGLNMQDFRELSVNKEVIYSEKVNCYKQSDVLISLKRELVNNPTLVKKDQEAIYTVVAKTLNLASN